MSRSEAINEIITKDPFAFSRTDNKESDIGGDFCNCRKSGCIKKYCDCFRKGKVCGNDCLCENCQNIEKFAKCNEPQIKGRKKVKL